MPDISQRRVPRERRERRERREPLELPHQQLFPNALPPPVQIEAALRLSPDGLMMDAVMRCPFCAQQHVFTAGPNGRAVQNVILSAPCATPKERRAGSRRVLVSLSDEDIRAAIHQRLAAQMQMDTRLSFSKLYQNQN